MPPSAPDDPAAYRGVRFTTWFGKVAPFPVIAGGRTVPWLESSADQYGPVANTDEFPDGPWFGRNEVWDGRRRMLWFFRLVEPLPTPPIHPSSHPPGGERAVLDVLTLPQDPASNFEWANCGPDPVIIVDDDGWRLNRTSGLIEPTDPDDAACPEQDD